jgi:predicted nucleic acid-binding protein
MKAYGLDTNIISYILKNDTVIINKIQDEIIKGNIFRIPAISYYEISRGFTRISTDFFKTL